ncbi:MAG TPA: toll/interleukin-1 receptor domain-containing protein [Methanocella sp.]|nr:toll/interleukin-1 receptor domain-containing protein [Methanocella sp.]
MRDDGGSRCERCGSVNLLFSKKRQLYICEDCGHEFKPVHRRRIFLGYGHDEYAYFAHRLHHDLEQAGYDIWIDIDRLVGGTDWEKFIEEGMEWISEYPGEGRHILLMTPYSVRRPDGFCLNEISRAIQRGIPLIPVMVVDSDVPAPIRGLPWLDARDCLPPEANEGRYKEKLEALARAIEGTAREGDLVTPDRTAAAVAPEAESPAAAGPLRIFISCAPEHRALAGRLKDDLIGQGFKVSFGLSKDRSAIDYELFVEDGLAWTAEAGTAGRFLLIMGPAAVRRPGGVCLNELSQAIAKKIPIVPVMASLCEPPLSICRVQWLDLRDCLPLEEKQSRYDVRLQQLVDLLRSGRMDVEGVQAHLMRVLDPIPFDADIQSHVAKFVGRRAAIADVCAWLSDPAGPRTLWLTGPPGAGKSAIAAWFAYNRPEVLAFHICSAEDAPRSDVRKFVLSVAYQLATQLPELQQYYGQLPLEDLVRQGDAAALFDHLIITPLTERKYYTGKRPALLIVDEIDGAAAAGNLPDRLAARFGEMPAWVRLMIVGRDDPRLAPAIARLAPRVLDLTRYDGVADAREYARARLGRHFGPGPGLDAAVERVAADSEGNMLYAECAVDEAILGGLTADSLRAFPRHLGAHYLRFFKRQFPDLERYKAEIRPALEVLCTAGRPVAPAEVAAVLAIDEPRAREACAALHGLFPLRDEMMVPFHRSLVQWLTDRERSAQYFVSAGKGRERLAGHAKEK